ncbi:MAG: hypothetical protein IJ200_12255 [Prevotella sp.]|nr:hypothetical protein [Prevotella sp.]
MAAPADGTIDGRYALRAAWVVESLFPPCDVQAAYRILVSLNLLNAMVKQPEGRRLTSYNYIKGMAACTFLWLLYHPLDDVAIWWDDEGSLTYFCLCDRQFSFHFVPLLFRYADKMRLAGLQPQQWDGLRLQEIGLELFEEAIAGLPPVDEKEGHRLLQYMQSFGPFQLKERVRGMEGVESVSSNPSHRMPVAAPRPYQDDMPVCVASLPRHRFLVSASKFEDPLRHFSVNALSERRLCLEIALKFNVWQASGFQLYRRNDDWCVRSLRYTGRNYRQMVETIVGGHPRVVIRPKSKLRVGYLYYLCRTDRVWRCVSPSRHMLLLAHYNYLRVGFKNFNLCVTYAVALHLCKQFPSLRFVNVLNYSRMTCHRRTYSYSQLLKVPRHSQSRWRKVWLVSDPDGLLADYDVDTLPTAVVNEYLMADDYYQFFQVVVKNGCEGLKAYSRFHLLAPVWAKVRVQGHYAYVMAHNRKWAIYALMEECFVSGFIYNSIWLDRQREVIVGRIDNRVVDIHELYC